MLLAVYGTLRKGDNLYDNYIDPVKALGQERLTGYEMYSLGPYPYVTRDYREEGQGILVEVYDLPAGVLEAIVSMEQSAGYTVAIEPTAFGDVLLFRYTYQDHVETIQWNKQQGRSEIVPVPDGDWIKYQSSNVNTRRKRKHGRTTYS